eukprot:4930290-Amphidinium_carterae.1
MSPFKVAASEHASSVAQCANLAVIVWKRSELRLRFCVLGNKALASAWSKLRFRLRLPLATVSCSSSVSSNLASMASTRRLMGAKRERRSISSL